MIKNSALEKNREYSDKYIQKISNPILSKEMKNFLSEKKIKKIIDLGCGDGYFIHSIKEFDSSLKIVGIDISPRRINNLKEIFPNEEFYVRDVCDTGLREKFDFVHSSQVIEHLENDKKMVEETKRLLKPKGYVYVSSVIKKPWAIYKYRNNGKFVLDPTHEKEYKNKKEFLDLFKDDFKLIFSRVTQLTKKKLGIWWRIPGFYLIGGLWQKTSH